MHFFSLILLLLLDDPIVLTICIKKLLNCARLYGLNQKLKFSNKNLKSFNCIALKFEHFQVFYKITKYITSYSKQLLAAYFFVRKVTNIYAFSVIS